MTLWKATLAEFREQTASSAPTPGGGSVACVCAAFGLGLVQMALEITRRSAIPEAPALDAFITEAHALSAELVAHADRDVSVFQAYMAAVALPRSTDDEKRARKAALSTAAFDAAEAPLAAAADMLAGLALAEKVFPVVKPNVTSDVLGGADILEGSIAASLRNVDVNIPSLASDALRERVVLARETIARQAAESRARLAAAIPAPSAPKTKSSPTT
jgi:formiminotetrahydrofolate cyclodeaminase